MKKKFMCMLMAAAMTLSMAACGSKGDDANTDDNAGGTDNAEVQTFKLGSSGPLTGDNAIYGMAVKQGVELAVNEINASDSTIKFEFLSQDDEADGEKAVNAYNNMMDNGMQVLVGPTTTGASIAVADACYTDRTFMLTPSASSTDVTADKDNVFQVCFTDPNQGVGAADYMAENFADAKIAVIYRNDDAYSQGIRDAFVKEAGDKGLSIVYQGTYLLQLLRSARRCADCRRRPRLPSHLLSARFRDLRAGQGHGLCPHLLRRGRHGRHPRYARL